MNVETLGQPAVGGGDGLLGKYYAGTNSSNSSPTTPTYHAHADARRSRDRFQLELHGPFDQLSGRRISRSSGPAKSRPSTPKTIRSPRLSDDGVGTFRQRAGGDQRPHRAMHRPSIPVRRSRWQAGQSYAIEVDLFPGRRRRRDVSELVQPAHRRRRSFRKASCSPARRRPPPPTCKSTAISGTQTELTWTTNSTDEDGYEVDRMLGQLGHIFARGLPASRLPTSTWTRA